MNVEPDFGDTPIEDDPTGMRRLLAGLPDPGPMPDDLTARILASIASEAAARRESAERHVAGSRYARVTSLTHRRRGSATPQSLRWLAAAAAVGVFGAGGFGLIRMLGTGMSASNSGAALTTPSRQAGDQDQERGSAGPPVLASDPRIVVTSSGTDYAAATLAEQARSLTRQQDAVLNVSGPARLSTREGARACATALGIGSFSELRVDTARFQGDPAAVIVVKTGSTWRAYAVPLTCGDASTVAAMAGPIAVP